MANIQAPGIEEIAGSVPFQKDAIVQKEYGRFLEDFVDGDLYVHPLYDFRTASLRVCDHLPRSRSAVSERSLCEGARV